MLKNNKAIGAFIIIIALIGLSNSLVRRTSHVCPLLSATELQERLGVKVDGIIGTETMAAWDRAYSDQQGIESCSPYVGEDGYLDFYDER